ncbi:MAG: nucleotidyltransferase domain-containing protein [Bacteroidota bacterium]
MFTRKAVAKVVEGFIAELKSKGYNPTQAILFGSYAKGSPQEHSDIDLAVWDDKFSGCLPEDIENMIKLKVKKPVLLELHTYHSSETVDSDPFIGEILSHGIPIKVA